MILKNAARPLTICTLLALALTACSTPEAGSAPSSTGPVPTSAAPTPSKSSGPWGDFPTAAQACAKLSEQATASTLLPLSAAQGTPAELEQTKAELTRTAERAPGAVKADFTTLSEVAIAGIKDQTVFSSGKLQDAMAPVQGWLAANCK